MQSELQSVFFFCLDGRAVVASVTIRVGSDEVQHCAIVIKRSLRLSTSSDTREATQRWVKLGGER